MRNLVWPSAVLLVLVLAGTAAACPAPTANGVVQGTMLVGKTHTGCLNDGSDSVGGNGLGISPLGAKTAYWLFSGATTTFSPPGSGSVDWCGQMSGVQGGLGASCHSHAGSGRGTISYSGQLTWVKFSWPTSVGGTIPVTGEASVDVGGHYPMGKKNHPKSPFAMVMSMAGGSACMTKPTNGPGKGVGATTMTMTGAWQIG